MRPVIRIPFLAALLGAALACAGRAESAVFCVGTSTGLQNALTTAAGNGEATNTIQLRGGTYLASGGGFTYSRFSGSGSLDIEGGWDAGCATQTPDASLTILDGQSAGPILAATNYLADGGDITVRYASFLHGLATSNAGAAALDVTSQGATRIENCRFRLDRADAADTTHGIVHVAVVDGPATFVDNVVANNSALGSDFVVGFDFAVGASTIAVYLNDNTIADNAFDTTDASAGAVFLSPLATASLANNILWGNGGQEFLQNVTIQPVMLSNDVDVLNVEPGPGSSGNRNQIPQFVNINNHHLLPTSPLYNAGQAGAPGGDGAVDLDGNPRIMFGAIDIGAYELQEEPDAIFANGFDGA